MTSRWTDETLMAFADGELDAETASQLAADAATDHGLQAAITGFRTSADAVRQAFGPLGAAPVPERLVAATTRPAGVRIFDFAAADRSRRLPRLNRLLVPLAASLVALMIGYGAGFQAGRPTADTNLHPASGGTGGDPTDDAFEAALIGALATGRDGALIAYGGPSDPAAGVITVLGPAGATVATGLGAECRLFRHDRTRPEGHGSSRGLACQSGGAWSVMTLPAGPVR